MPPRQIRCGYGARLPGRRLPPRDHGQRFCGRRPPLRGHVRLVAGAADRPPLRDAIAALLRVFLRATPTPSHVRCAYAPATKARECNCPCRHRLLNHRRLRADRHQRHADRDPQLVGRLRSPSGHDLTTLGPDRSLPARPGEHAHRDPQHHDPDARQPDRGARPSCRDYSRLDREPGRPHGAVQRRKTDNAGPRSPRRTPSTL